MKTILVFAMGFVVSLMAATACEAAYARAEITIPNSEHPVESYKDAFEKEVLPEFIAELKKENPAIDEKRVVERITVRADQGRDRLWIYVEAEHEPTGIAEAHRLGEMALRKFIASDQAERTELIDANIREQERLKAAVEALEKELEPLAKDPRLDAWPDKPDSLEKQVKAHKEELVQAELRKAELEAKLKLLSYKAARVKDTVSIEEVALLQKTAQELVMQLDESSKQQHENELKRLAIVLKQKEEMLEDLKPMVQAGRASSGQLRDAEADVELARHEYDFAKGQMDRVKDRLLLVMHRLDDAKASLAETGGLHLVTIIAQQTLECETEMAGVELKIQDLRQKTAAMEKEIADIRSFADEYARRHAEPNDLLTRLNSLQEEEQRLEDGLVRATSFQRGFQRFLKDFCRVSSVQKIEPEHVGIYDVVGEVSSPGARSFEEETTLMKAITAAGGFTKNADTARVVVIGTTRRQPEGVPAPRGLRIPARPGQIERHVIDSQAILDRKAQDDFMIKDRDIVLVPKREIGEPRAVEGVKVEGPAAFFVIGEVKEPGPKSLKPKATLLDGISESRGFTADADRQRVTLIRRTNGSFERLVVDRSELMGAKPADDPLLKGNDIVFVPCKGAGELRRAQAVESLESGTYYLLGEIKSPGSRTCGPKTTLLQAIAEAGGFTDFAKDTAVAVIRRGERGTERHEINVSAVLKGQSPDSFLIKPGDVVFVPRKGLF